MSRPKSRYPKLVKVNGKVVCRGCGGDVPNGRHTWCSSQCYDTNCPQRVNYFVRQRDKHVCQICKQDIIEMIKARVAIEIPTLGFLPGESHMARWHRQNDLESKMRGPEIREEYDHIIPFSRGGKTVLENMRTVCSPCHKKTPTYGSKCKKFNPSTPAKSAESASSPSKCSP